MAVNEIPLVTVVVGTDHHPFDRLVNWSLDLAGWHALEGRARWFIQYGTSAWPTTTPAGVDGASMLTNARLRTLMAASSCVVTHGGPGLLMDAGRAGHRPVVVPRDPHLGEHVDAHQQRFVARIAGEGRVRAVGSFEEFRRAVERAIDEPSDVTLPVGNDDTLDRFAQLVDRVVRCREGARR